IAPDPNHKCVTETLTLKIHNDYKEQYQRIIGSSDMYWPKYKVTYYTNNDIPGGKKLLEEIRSGVFYDKIVSIEEVEELQDVYDVTIPENHLFWLDNVISHNTK